MRLLAIFMCFAMLATVTPIFASADDSTPYLGINESTGKADKECFVSVENVITDGTKDLFVTGWNIVKGDVEFEERIVLPGSVNLILENGATLTATKGITVAEDGDFAIYAQSTDPDVMGKLVVPEGVSEYDAGIGGAEGKTCGNITIYGGMVSVCGGGKGAAIGSSGTKTCGNITISGGIIDAVSTGDGAGIGSGREASCGTVTITDGYIRAECGEGAQPIGAGYLSSTVSVSVSMSCISTTMGTVRYINYAPIAGTDPTCTKAGSKAYCLDLIGKNYYETFPFYEDRLIGNASAISTWYAEGGAGYLAPLGHDWQQVDADKHKCTRCDAIEMHTDKDENNLCDMCGVSVVPYLGYNEETGKADLQCAAAIDNVIDEVTDSFVTGWNIIKGNIEFENRIELPKDVKLILADGATLTADKGITVAENGNFSVYAQSIDEDTMGKLIVPESVEENGAGIGSGSGGDCGSIAIFGGTVSVQGGNGAAGIGSGYYEASCGDISILGGIVTAQGGNSAAGIGTGFNSSCGVITISGGNVIAQGEGYGSGVGVGNGVNALCNKVSITGGYIKASTEMDDNYIEAKQVSIDSSFETKYTADSMYINCIPFEETEADCTNNGALAYFKDSINDIYYTDFPFTEAVLIGDADALDAWKAEEGAGHKENPLGHDWQYQDGAKHICQRCKTTKAHVDEDEDTLCDMCGAIVITYLDYNETTGQADLSRTVWVNNIITDGTTDSFVSGWNMVKGNVTFENRIVLPKDVNLILADGATLNAVKGITVAEDGDFAVYAQSTDSAVMGKLIVPEGVDEHSAGIGAIYSKNCGNISIYGGRVTANAGYGAAGIGSGYTGNCASVSVYGGYVVAKGGYGAAGVGSGWAAASSCYKVTIAGGHIKATAGTLADGIEAEEVSMDDSFVVLKEGSSSYVNCKEAKEPTCTDSGFSECFVDPVSCYYYSAFPFAEGGIIGGNTAFAIWKAKNGDGYIAPLGHDWQYYDNANHVCQRCEATQAHIDENEDSLCDVCGAKHTTYLDYNELTGQEDLSRPAWANIITDGATDTFVTGWNVVEGNVTFENRIVLPKDVNLILADGATLTAKKGITVAENGSFAVYAQSTDKDTMGKLIVSDGVEDNYPGIGSSDKVDCGDIAIHGGVVTVVGGVNGAGIGSSFDRSCGNIIIDGGLVTANGGYGSAGVGSGDQGDCGKVMISGGMVAASSGYGAAGIGSGFMSSCEGVVISGGLVIAQGGERAAGIGGGYATSCGEVTISSGNIKATAGGSNADPIGSGELADPVVEVNMLPTCTSTIIDKVQYVNCELFPETEPDCITIGALAYFKDSIKGMYYTDFPFTEEVLIGDDDALAAWKAEGGAGHRGNAWGHNWAYVAGNTHKCARCNLVENHTDEDKDGMCDVCSVPLTMHLGYNETTGKADLVCYAYVEHVIDEATDSFASGWNIVKGNVTFDERITLPGEVHLILEDGATLTAKKGITVASFGDFSIYAQSADESTMGKLIVPEGVDVNNAGIGPIEGGICGNISIYGGKITAYGGESAAGIGGAYGDSEHTCGKVTIYGGIVNAYGGKSGSGIGVGEKATCKKVIIKGGIVNAFGGLNGAGIGGSYYGIEISGGRVTAVGGDNSAGIGSGYATAYCNKVDITGGYIKAVAGNKGAQPIGGAAMSGAVQVTIDPLCTSVTKKTVEQYVNYEPVDAVEPTCTENGTLAYVKDSISGNYYTDFPFTEDILIGDATAFATWIAEGGAGYVPALGHDWEYVNGSTHKCKVCKLTEEHTDEDEDLVCDICKEIIPVYLDYNDITGVVDINSLASDAKIIDNAEDRFTNGWNIIKGNVVFEDRIVLPQNVNLILANGATLTAKKGITVAEDGNLSIYAQSNDMTVAGKLVVPEKGVDTFSAAIGSESGGKCGDIAIYGGNITCCSGVSGAGIGSGFNGECGDIAIYSGFVTAANGGTGIGCGLNGTCKTIHILGGLVTAQGAHGCAGSGSRYGRLTSCGEISITGGYIKATAETGSEPIGAGEGSSPVNVSIDALTCTSVIKDGAQYINYEPFKKVEPTCAIIGSLAYVKDFISGNYYTDFPFVEDEMIGNEQALAAWKAKGGAGYLPLIPYHTDENEDGICDVCENTLTTYLDYNESTGKVDIERTVLAQVNVIDDKEDSFVTGWNIVKGNVEFGYKDARVELPKDVKLILADGANLTVCNGISVATDGGFSIYAQSVDSSTMGKLNLANAIGSYKAGIGGDQNRNCGKISIYGGALTVYGGYHGAAIGAGSDASCDGVEIFGGNVTAVGGRNAAGIGSGYGSSTCDHVTIYGGNVTTEGEMYGAGIGSSYGSSCGNITIYGGFVAAKGGLDNSAGIGAGYNATCNGVSIVGGYISATPGGYGQPIGGAAWRKEEVPVSIDSSCTSILKDGIQYINYEPFDEVIATCKNSGCLAHFKDYITGNYYTEYPFTEDGLIGDATAFAAWNAEGGAGYSPELSYHTDENEDGICDICENTLPTYLNYDSSSMKADMECILLDKANVIDDEEDSFVTGWNIVKGNVEFADRIELPKDVNLILEDGATLTADAGISVALDGDFAIFAQSTDPDTMGKIIVPNGGAFKFFAGIGSEDAGTCGNIVIFGGSVTSYGGENAAGIGAGDEGECGNIIILGGIVTAKGATGIGSGTQVSSCGSITISGGIIDAESVSNGAGIGAGYKATCDKVTITGGYVKAVTGSENAQPIGAGEESSAVEVSINEMTCTSVIYGNLQYINYEETAAKEATCTTVGTLGYFTDYISGNYYTSFPFTENGLIGDATAFAAWKAQGGAGYLEKIPHKDTDGDHYCDGCHATDANYLDYNEITGKVDIEREMWGVDLVIDGLSSLSPGWYIVIGDVTTENRITLTGDTKLILANGASLNAKKGISMSDTGNLAIYAQSNDKDMMGKLIVPEGVNNYDAGIGSSNTKACGNIFIYGGMVTVQGGKFAPAIGSAINACSCDITIRGGVVKAQGGYAGAAIGSGENCSCGNITISGGIVTATGSYSAGIGSGSGIGASCGNITISGGAVIATGANDGAGIGSGAGGSRCGTITISGGYVKATATSRADPIGTGYQSSCGKVSIDDSFTLVKEGTTQYINYKIPGQDPTCTDAGFTTYYIDPVNNIFYTALSFATNKRIGDAEALATWKAQGGGGYIAPYGHDWKFVDEDIHECLRCKATEEHTGADDFICDDCNGILLETAIAVTKAKGEAKAELKEAVGEKPSDKLAEILSDACEAVDAATTLDGIATVKEQGLSDIAAQKATELEAKRAEILPRWESILESDEYSDVVKSMVREFVSRVNAAETLKEIDYVVDMYAPAIQLRSARDHWIAELEGLLPEEPSATVISIVEDACELIENDEDMWAFSYVYDITRQAVERQLVTEANMEAMDILLKQAAEDLETANNTIATLNNTIKSKDATIAEKQAAFDTATEQLNAAKAALEVSKVDLEKAQANIEELEGTVSEQDEALKQAKQDLENKQAALDEMTENYNTASAALATAQKNLEETTKALNEAVTANEQTKKDLEEANASLKTANDTIVELNNTIKSKDATIAEKQAALDTATEQLNVAKTDLETTKTNLEKAKANIEELEGMVSEQDEALKQAAQDLKDTQETLAKAEQDIKDLQAEIDRLKALLDDDPQLEGKIGDVNCDDLIDMKDVLLLRKYLVGIDKIDKLKTADCNGDGEVDMKDVLTLRKYLAGYIETLDV